MFEGFDKGTFEFFMALSFNNNRDFFHSNHAWYEQSVRAPLRGLCMELASGMLEIDGELEVRPARVISHINRDLRYSRDKSPYRENMWLGFHRMGCEKKDCLHFYFDINALGAHVGVGMYGADRLWTDGIRRLIRGAPETAGAIFPHEGPENFESGGAEYRRMAVPEGTPAELAHWYLRKSFYVEHAYSPAELMSAALAEDILSRLKRLKLLYDFMYSIRPERRPDRGEAGPRRAISAGDAPPCGW